MTSPAEYAQAVRALAVNPLAGRGAALPAIEVPDLAGDLIVVEMAPGTEPFNITAPDWVDYSSRVTDISISRGRGIETARIDVGSLTITLDNTDQALDSFADADIAVNMPVRVSVIADGSTVQLFQGFVDAGTFVYSFPSLHDVTFSATDGLRYFARDELDAYVYTSTNNRPDEILDDYLDDLGWPAGLRALDTADRKVDTATTTFSGNGLSFVDAVTLAEGPTSVRFINREGEFDFRSRRAIETDSRSTGEVLTFTNRASTTGLTVPVRYSDITAGLDTDTLYNKAAITRESSGVVYTDSDATSITANGPSTIAYTAMLDGTGSGPQDATLLVDLYSAVAPRVTSLTTVCLNDSAEFAAVAALDIRDRVRVVHGLPGLPSPDELDVDLFIESINITITKANGGSRYTASFGFANCDKYDALTGSW